MESLLPHLLERGYLVLFAVVLLEAIGVPVPAALALLIAGGASGRGIMDPARSLATAMSAMLTGDICTFLLGRYTGWWLLGTLCRISLNPEACILRSADSFFRRGRRLLLFAKFVPGINSLAPPVAGSMNMRFWQFLGLDSLGAVIYVGAYWSLGFIFSDALQKITSGYQAVGKVISWIIVAAAIAYIAYQVYARMKAPPLRAVHRTPPEVVASFLYSDQGEMDVAVYDVRSHGYYDPNAVRIRNSRRLEPNALNQYPAEYFQAKQVFLYCTCIREATSSRVAYLLRQQGVQSYVIEGGLRAWKKAGLPLEPVPQDEIIALPSFGGGASRRPA
jgi:membrane protein DedA with SNARE-associated domain/rhodanese-related sulfurtransferase